MLKYKLDLEQLKENSKLHQKADISAIGSGTQRKTVRTDRQYQGQTTETIADKEEGESKTGAEAEIRVNVCDSKTGVRRV